MSEAKLTEGIFVGPDTRILMSDEYLLFMMTEVE
jgi:hypothetical protein